MSDGINVHELKFSGSGVFNPDTLAQAHAALDAVEADDTIQALFMTGEGKNFSQGLDLEYLMANPDVFADFVTQTMYLAGRLLAFPVPVVSLVNGHAFGLGAMLVLASDYAVMRNDRGFFCLPEVDIGMTLTVRMNALVKAQLSNRAVRDTLLTGGRLTADQALAHGIVDSVGAESELDALARQVCAPMVGKPRHLLSGLKYGHQQALIDLIFSDAADDPITAPGLWPRS